MKLVTTNNLKQSIEHLMIRIYVFPDAQVEKVESAVSSARRFAGPYLDHIQECQFVATVRSTADSSYNLVLMLKVAVGENILYKLHVYTVIIKASFISYMQHLAV